MSVRETERLIKKILSAPIEKDVVETIDHQFLYTEVENKLKTILGSKINVKAKTNNKGKIEIEYFSKDELERITEMLYSIEK